GLLRDKVRLQPQTGRTYSRLALWNRHLNDRRHELVVFGDSKSKPAGARSQ
ncbi:hypothetical protein QR685DRAFT_430135, partial [Neurospora intermedia]